MIFQTPATDHTKHQEVAWLAVLKLLVEIFTTPFFFWSLGLLWLAQVGLSKFVEVFFSTLKTMILP